MFFIVLLRWIFYWIDHVVKPLLLSSYLYVILGTWLLIAGSITLLFFAFIDVSRIRYMYKSVFVCFIQNALMVMVVLTMLYALFECALQYMATSDFFYHHMHACSGLFALGHDIFMQFTTSLFLVGTTLLSVRSVSEIAYQLQDNKNWWFYTGLMTTASLVCYGVYMLFGYV